MKFDRSVICLAALLLSPLALGCDSTNSAGGFLSRIGSKFSGNTISRSAQRMEDPYFPDERREGMNELVDRGVGKRSPYTDRYKLIAASDSDYLVRATAIRELNRSRDQSAGTVFVTALSDANPQVRLEACKALRNLPNADATPRLLKLVQDNSETRDVRIAAADALRNTRTLEVARTLITQLGDREFGLAWQARRSLEAITGKDLQYDESAWLNYVTGPDKPLG